MYNTQSPQSTDKVMLVGKAIQTLYDVHKWSEGHIRNAQMLSLEGEKRRHRYFTNKCHKMANHKQCKAYDVFGVDLDYKESSGTKTSYGSDEEFFTATLVGYEKIHDDLHDCANKLVVANSKEFATCLYDLACLIQDHCIIDLRRKLKRKAVIKSGKSDHDTLVYETSFHDDDANTHDHWEKLESEL